MSVVLSYGIITPQSFASRKSGGGGMSREITQYLERIEWRACLMQIILYTTDMLAASIGTLLVFHLEVKNEL